MAIIKLKPHIKSLHGRIGNVVYYHVNGYQYARSYAMPRNPRTEAQQRNRTTFAEAVRFWQQLSVPEKSWYNRRAAGMPLSGYNLFISMYLKGLNNGRIPIQCRQINYLSIPAPCLIAANSVPASSVHVIPENSLSGRKQVLKKPRTMMLFAA